MAETVSATKLKLGRDEALELARGADRVLAARGRRVTTFDMQRGPPEDETLLGQMLGPTGNLRAPTLRRGRTLLVGFHEDEFAPVLTGKS